MAKVPASRASSFIPTELPSQPEGFDYQFVQTEPGLEPTVDYHDVRPVGEPLSAHPLPHALTAAEAVQTAGALANPDLVKDPRTVEQLDAVVDRYVAQKFGESATAVINPATIASPPVTLPAGDDPRQLEAPTPAPVPRESPSAPPVLRPDSDLSIGAALEAAAAGEARLEAADLPEWARNDALAEASDSAEADRQSGQALTYLPGALPPGDDGAWRPDSPQLKTSVRRTGDDARRFDQTQLLSKCHGLAPHRDYLAHCLRWGWVGRQVEQGMFVLDIGCGQEQPFARVLAMGVNARVPAMMVQCDLSPISRPLNTKWSVTLDRFNFITHWPELLEALPASPGVDPDQPISEDNPPVFESKYEVIGCFEVVEHMHTADVHRLLFGIKQLLHSEGRVFLSTPVFSGKAAVNHCHEYGIEELQALIEAEDLRVITRVGTFASATKLLPALTPGHRTVFEELKGWFGNDVMSALLAPLYADHSSNNLWVLAHAENTEAVLNAPTGDEEWAEGDESAEGDATLENTTEEVSDEAEG